MALYGQFRSRDADAGADLLLQKSSQARAAASRAIVSAMLPPATARAVHARLVAGLAPSVAYTIPCAVLLQVCLRARSQLPWAFHLRRDRIMRNPKPSTRNPKPTLLNVTTGRLRVPVPRSRTLFRSPACRRRCRRKSLRPPCTACLRRSIASATASGSSSGPRSEMR